jgi:hypothetical protein
LLEAGHADAVESDGPNARAKEIEGADEVIAGDEV